MSDLWPDLAGIRGIEVEFDASTGKFTSPRAKPHEGSLALEAVAGPGRILADQPPPSAWSSSRSGLPAAAAPARACNLRSTTTAVRPQATIAEACGGRSRLQVRSKASCGQTRKHADEPAIRVLRQSIGEPVEQRHRTQGDARPAIDLKPGDLAPARRNIFINEFCDFPSRQGKRATSANARGTLAPAGKMHCPANVNKRLGYVRHFIGSGVKKGLVNPLGRTELGFVLAQDTRQNRRTDLSMSASPSLAVDGGTVPFDTQYLKAPLGAAFAGHAERSAARHGVPLIGLRTGMRVGENSAVQWTDVVGRGGIVCIQVRPHDGPSPEHRTTRFNTAASRCEIPVHPNLVEVGVMQHVGSVRHAGRLHLWRGPAWHEKDGCGRFPSRDFRTMSGKVGVRVPRRKVFHRIRSTFQRALEPTGLATERIERFLGHDIRSMPVRRYGSNDAGTTAPIARMYQAPEKVAFPVDPPSWDESNRWKRTPKRVQPRAGRSIPFVVSARRVLAR